MKQKIKLTTLGIELVNTDAHPDGCPILKAWLGNYSPDFVHAMQETVEIVEDDKADVFLLPSNVSFYSPQRLNEIGKLVSDLQFPSIGFDISHECRKPSWLDYIVRFSWYRSINESGAIISPAFLNSDGFDLMTEFGLRDWQPMEKEALPSVSFCGREGGDLGLAIWKIMPKRLTRSMAANYFCSTTRGIRMTCCYPLRVDAMEILEKDPRIKTDFIRRGTVGLTPKAQGHFRRQFFDNLIHNPYSLCVRGTDNYSWRFYEALSIGRIPILIDTNCILPLEDDIPWDDFIVRVPSNQLLELPDRLWDWHSRISNSDFCELQRELREIFKRLVPARFYPEILTQVAGYHVRNSKDGEN